MRSFVSGRSVASIATRNEFRTTRIRVNIRYIARRIFRCPCLPFFLIFIVVIIQIRLHLPSIGVSPDSSQDQQSALSVKFRVLVNPRLERDLASGLGRCTTLRRPEESAVRVRNGHWQYHSADKEIEIVVYSAFFDDRPVLDLKTWIRVIGVASLSSKPEIVYCHVWYDSHATPYVTRAVANVTGRKIGYTHNNRTYVQYVFSCSLPGVEPVPSHVSLVTGREGCVASSIYLPVQRSIRSGPDQDIGVCVAVAFGTIPAPVFVEWIELHRLLGVTEFNVYDANMTGMNDVFDYYRGRSGLLRVFPAPPAIDLFTLDGIKLGSAASLNDCMMRNMYRYELILVIDFDEFIIPRMHRNYSAMLDDVDRANHMTERYRGYNFRNAYFFRETQSDVSQPAYLRTAVHRKRTELAKYSIGPKSFVDPRRCLSVFNHFCFLPLMNDRRPRHIDVNASLAVVHHYRRCGFPKSRCNEYYAASYQDDTALRFKDELKPRVEFVLSELQVLP